MRYIPLKPLFDRAFWPMVGDDDEWADSPRVGAGLNVYEDNGDIFVQAPVPGVPAENIKVTYEDGVLRISARTSEEEEKRNKKGVVVHQWNRTNAFEYATMLPKPIDVKKVEAEVRDGIIEIKAKVAEESKAREIPVKKALK